MLGPRGLELLANEGPVAVDSLSFYQQIQVFLVSPLASVNLWVKMVIPFFTTVLVVPEVEPLRQAIDLEGHFFPVPSGSLSKDIPKYTPLSL